MIPVTFTADPLPSDFQGTMQDFQDVFLRNLTGHIDEAHVLTGQIGGSKPTYNIGPWLNNDAWWVWNGSEYAPSAVKVGGAGYVVQLGSATTVGDFVSSAFADKTQTLQDKNGVIALLSDVYEGRAASVLSGTTPTINWAVSNNFTETLSGDTSIKMSSSMPGQEISVALRNSGTAWLVTWPGYIFWPGGTPPVQTESKTDVYHFKNIGGSIFGRQVPNY